MTNYYIFLKTRETLLILPLMYMIMALCFDLKGSRTYIQLHCAFGVLTTILIDAYTIYSHNRLLTFHQLVPLTVVIPSFIIFSILTKHWNLQFCFMFLTISILAVICNVMSRILAYWMFQGNFYAQISMRIALLLGVYLAIRTFFCKAIKYMLQDSGNSPWLIITYPLIVITIWLSLSSSPSNLLDAGKKLALPYNMYLYPDELFYFFLILLSITLGFTFVGHLYNSNQKYYEEMCLTKFLDMQTEDLKNRCILFNEKEQALRIIRHDMRHHRDILYSLLLDHRVEESLEYIYKLGYELEETKLNIICENPIINATLSIFSQKAKELGVTIDFNINHIPTTLAVDSTALSLVFANTIENAIHACKLLAPEKREIRFVFRYYEEQFIFEISNRYKNEIEFDENNYPTNPNRSHGYGTKSILAFKEKYDALVDYDITQEHFKLRMLVMNHQTKQ